MTGPAATSTVTPTTSSSASSKYPHRSNHDSSRVGDVGLGPLGRGCVVGLGAGAAVRGDVASLSHCRSSLLRTVRASWGGLPWRERPTETRWYEPRRRSRLWT